MFSLIDICPDLNHTLLTLIPKVKCPKRVSDFCLIALCKILYKLVSKVLANRLKQILPNIISDTQSVFQFDKAISDNILVAFKFLHHMKTKKAGKSGFMALKLDMSKTYDRVEWVFFIKIMEKMGFHSRWIQLITKCISTISYSILVNEEAKGNIKPSRGVRQGDPLSPYLFLIVSKGLTSLIHQATHVDRIWGFSLCKNGLKITQLFFCK